MNRWGGDRKSNKFHQQKEGKKKILLVTDFLAAKKSKERHLKRPKVIAANKNLEREEGRLNSLTTKLKGKEIMKSTIAVKRCEMEELIQAFFIISKHLKRSRLSMLGIHVMMI